MQELSVQVFANIVIAVVHLFCVFGAAFCSTGKKYSSCLYDLLPLCYVHVAACVMHGGICITIKTGFLVAIFLVVGKHLQ